MKRFLEAHNGNVDNARMSLEDALTWHAWMTRWTDYRNRQFAAAFRGLGYVTAHATPAALPNSPIGLAVIWYLWGAAKPDQIFDGTDTSVLSLSSPSWPPCLHVAGCWAGVTL